MDKIKDKSKTSVRSVKKSTKVKSNNENRKVNQNKDKKLEKAKKEKYSTTSSQTVLKDMKTTATRRLNSIRNTFDNFSQRLKLSSIQNQEMTNNMNDCKNYRQFAGTVTPTQLYSPFGFETPSPRVDRTHLRRSCCRQVFFSPTAKIKDDVLYLNNGIKQLNLISQDIENRFSPSNSINSFDSNQSLI